MKWTIEHDEDCPLGVNGLRAFDEAAYALASLPPEALVTRQDKFARAQAWMDLEAKQHCTCGADEARAEIIRSEYHRKPSTTP